MGRMTSLAGRMTKTDPKIEISAKNYPLTYVKASRSIKHVKRCYFAYKNVDISENFPLAPSALATLPTKYLGWKLAKK